MMRQQIRRIAAGVRRRTLGRADLKNRISQLGADVSSLSGAGVASFGNYRVHYSDPLVFYMELKDIFHRKIYDFDSGSAAPRILDCGSHIGMSILYFKHKHPKSHITAFEPDPTMLPILQRNLEENRISGVELINAALASEEGTVMFVADPRDAGHVASGGETAELTVPARRLSPYVKERIDFLKMNIEGAELEVLKECDSRLTNVDQMVVEYHGLPRFDQYLHRLLEVLDSQGFRYLVHDFDEESVSTTKPPFRLDRETQFFLLVYAKQLSSDR